MTCPLPPHCTPCPLTPFSGLLRTLVGKHSSSSRSSILTKWPALKACCRAFCVIIHVVRHSFLGSGCILVSKDYLLQCRTYSPAASVQVAWSGIDLIFHVVRCSLSGKQGIISFELVHTHRLASLQDTSGVGVLFLAQGAGASRHHALDMILSPRRVAHRWITNEEFIHYSLQAQVCMSVAMVSRPRGVAHCVQGLADI